jgi:hypothetical protein
MKSWQKATVIALIHVAIVCSLGAKLLYDRATRPRVWVKTQNYDPNLPIRGRYVALRPLFDDPTPTKLPETKNGPAFPRMTYDFMEGTISVVDGKAIVNRTDGQSGAIRFTRTWDVRNWDPKTWDANTRSVLTTWEPVLYFIPDTAPNPSALKAGEELWVELTIPRKGPPRPIQLALKSNGKWLPIDIH